MISTASDIAAFIATRPAMVEILRGRRQADRQERPELRLRCPIRRVQGYGDSRHHRPDQGVVQVALQDAASIAGLLITTEGIVADRPEPKGQPGMPPGGGMGGMGDMDY